MVMTLRAAREDLGLSINEIMALLKKNADITGASVPSPTSVRSVLNGDLDKISGFSLETLSPMRDVLIHQDAGTTQDRINALLDVLRMQEETIQHLTDQIAQMEASQQTKCAKCESDRKFYMNQIQIKDRRMERKDRWIAELLKLPREENDA